MKICVIIPVYNSGNLIIDVIQSVMRYTKNLIVVNDGSTDGTLDAIRHCCLDAQSLDESITLISYEKNRGKGYALKQGFKRALELGFTHGLTMDADGQHLASNLDILIKLAENKPHALIVGARKFDNPNMPQGSRFANNFSNFWFRIQTGRRLPDTQSGFRVYPLRKTGTMRLVTNRYEAELEILVRSAWRNIPIVSQAVEVYYPPMNERISHFRGGRDFFRISVLNTVLCFFAVVWGYPSMVWHFFNRLKYSIFAA